VIEAGELVSTSQPWSIERFWRRRVKYLVLIWSNPASREIWEGFSDDQRAEGYRYYAASPRSWPPRGS
jgi:hypothetical protein